MIRTEALTKEFRTGKKGKDTLRAVDSLTLEAHQGEVFGFLGPNGAGKTTTVRLLCCLIAPTGGQAFINGLNITQDAQKIRQTVGILTETPGMYDRLSAEKNLTIYANLYGVAQPERQVEKYLSLLGLWERRYEEVGSFSKGMRQKLAIARALLHEPQVLFLDEPTSGLDPQAAKLVRDFIADLKDAGRTIFLCTHNLDEAERLCDRVAIFRSRLIAVDTPQALRDRLYGKKIVFHLQEDGNQYLDPLRDLPFVKNVQVVEGRLVVGLDDPLLQNPLIVERLVATGAHIQFIGELRHSLEDIYLEFLHQ